MSKEITDLPKSTDRYSFEIVVSRNPRTEGDKSKTITSLTYHALNYGALVKVEKALVDKMMPALSDMGIQAAEQMGYPSATEAPKAAG